MLALCRNTGQRKMRRWNNRPYKPRSPPPGRTPSIRRERVSAAAPRSVGKAPGRRTGRYLSTPIRIRRPGTKAAASPLARNTRSKARKAQLVCGSARARVQIGTGRKSARMPPDPGVQVASFDTAGLGGTKALNFEIRAFERCRSSDL